MTQLTIALPAEAQAYLDKQLAQGHYATADDVITLPNRCNGTM